MVEIEEVRIGTKKMKKKKTYEDAIKDVLDLIKSAKEKESGDALGDLERDVIRLLKKYKS